ncbi:outer membrane beta-barrel protein [Lewinella sp. IMCC34183]|uniref:outer membrane beta-barrel protein n=1 Tax=Lewinella sp. IMCC34183 TaxID=2248762 RepID=UPI000E225D68|nr:outer membrane beta-barrel protein [Lewinella sp. IMCC34183]
MNNQLLTLFAFLLLLGPVVSAQDVDVVIIEEEEEEERSFQLSGYVDAYFQNVFSDPNDETSGTTLGFPTSFTPENRGFNVGNVNLLAEKSLGKVGFVGQIGFGPRAIDANLGNDGDFGYYIPNLQQLYVTYAPSDAVTFTLGQFGTFVGYEVIDAPANANYSTSYLFSYGPFFHTGLKADFAITEGFGAMLGIFNNTDSRFNAPGYYYGAQLSAESGGLAAYLNFLYGTDAKDIVNDDDATTFQVDLTATYEVNDALMFGINASQKSTQNLVGDGSSIGDSDGFTGVALYSTIGISETFGLSLRGEYFQESVPEGITADGRSVTALTATGNFTVGDLRIMPEFRLDSGSDFGTTYSGGIIDFGGDDEDDSVASFILAAVYSF